MIGNTIAALKTSDHDFVTSRLFDAPRDLVFKAWVDPKRMAQWWWPHTFTNPAREPDPRAGGAYRIVMRGPGGPEYPIKGIYREVVPSGRLAMTMDCSKPPTGEMFSTVTFESVDRKTRLTVRTRFVSAAVREAMLKLGMTEGWSQSLERLADLLRNATDSNA